MEGEVLSDIGSEPQRVREGHVARVRLVAGAAGLVRQLQSAVAAVAVCKEELFIEVIMF